MTPTTSPNPQASSHGLRRGGTGLALLALSTTVMLVSVVGSAQAAATQVQLGTATSFAVLAGSGITNTGPTTVNGDLGSFPTMTITGTSTLTVNGTNHGGDAVTQQAKNDLVTAYDAAAAQGPTTTVAADLGGQTLAPGVYGSASSLGLTGTLTLDAGGNADAVFVFQAGSTLTTASASRVALINGAQACHVFWQVGSSATLGAASAFTGSVLALTSITVTNRATVDGRVLARNGAVTLDTNTISRPVCAAATGGGAASPSPSPTAGPSTSPTAGPSTSPAASPGSTTPLPASPTPAPSTVSAPAAGPTPTTPIGVTDQVVDVPRGPVAAGDGSAAATDRLDPARLPAALAIAVVGLAAVVRARRRTS